MDFDLSKPQKLLKESARELLARECPIKRVRSLMATDTAYDSGLWEAIVDQGWTGLMIPEEYGGLGLGLVELAAVAEEMGRACLPSPFISTVWASALIAESSNEDLRAKYLQAIAGGEMRATVALLEATGDWNPSAVGLRATRVADGYRLSGTKEFVTDAAVADIIICVARCDGELALLPVKNGASGLSVTPRPAIDDTRKIYTVNLENVLVPAGDSFGLDGHAGMALDRSTGIATVALCADMLGGMQWVLEDTVEYAKTRQQFGRPIGTYQAIQHHCADMLLKTESARSAVYYAACVVSDGDPMERESVSIAKAYCSDAAREVGNLGIQSHGGIGFTWEHDLHLFYKRAKSSEIMFGDANYHRERLAGLVIEQGSAR
jgi:alkylation response protein AidB-like acyl-CoA dehydrogenase